MTPYQQRLTEVTQRLAGDMKIRNLAQATIDAYTYHVQRFADLTKKPLDRATPEDVRNFQLHLIQERKVSYSSFNLYGMMHLSGNPLQERGLVDSDHRLALDSAMSSRLVPPIVPLSIPGLPP